MNFFRPAAVQAVVDSINARPTPATLGLGCWTGRRSPLIESLELDELFNSPTYKGDRP